MPQSLNPPGVLNHFIGESCLAIMFNPIIIFSVIVFITAMLVCAYSRRSTVSREGNDEAPSPDTERLDRILSYILLVAIVGAIASGIYVIAVPKEGEKYTEFYILDSEGMASEYPTQFPAGEPQTVIIGIGNHEYREVTYTVETLLLRQTFDPTTNTSAIYDALPLHTFSATLSHDETREFLYNFTVPNTRYNRIQFLLFNETVAFDEITGSDRINASYRYLHLWIEVQ